MVVLPLRISIYSSTSPTAFSKKMHIHADTIDDLLSEVLKKIIKSKTRTSNMKGFSLEEIGCLLVLKNPLTRLSRSESRSKLFSCLGETLWYLSGSSDIDQISYYIERYRDSISVSDRVKVAPGAYGPRLFGSGINNQFERVIQLLSGEGRHETRKAVVQIFDKSDLAVHLNKEEEGNDVPCTVSFQFLYVKKS